MRKICEVEGCGKKHFGRGWCHAHWYRWSKHGSPFGGRTFRGNLPKWIMEHVGYSGDDCLKWPFGKGSRGYGSIIWDGKLQYATRVMLTLTAGPPPSPDHEAAHSCGRGHEGCVNPKHLRWATHKENQADKEGHGTILRGEQHPAAKLSEADVLEIRASSDTIANLAAQFDVTPRNIRHIKQHTSWVRV